MQKITLSPANGQPKTCTIAIGAGALSELGSLFGLGAYSKVFVVTDETAAPLFLDKLMATLPAGATSVVLPAGEQHKHIDSVQEIWTALHQAGCDRQSLMINLGGGVIGDLGGFAASTYMRGLDFLNVPTTLLAQVDASIGGKTGCNFAGIKNLVGTFSQPMGVLIDTETLASLPRREYLSGFAEIIKHGLIADDSFFGQVTEREPLQFSPDEMADIIAQSCRIKSKVVTADGTEQGARKLLNFGHTIGHAVEALSLETDAPLLHGEAVAIGMLAEADLSVRQGLLQTGDRDRIQQALASAGLPTSAAGLSIEEILGKMKSDKKNNNGGLNFTLLDSIGHAVYNQQVPLPVLTEAIQAIIA